MLAGATLPKEEVPQGRGGRVAGTETSTNAFAAMQKSLF